MSKLYVVPFPIQQAEIKAYCWGPGCGKGAIGAIDLDLEGLHGVPCNEETCPHLDKQMDEPMGEVDGRPVYLRKLKEVKSG